MHFTTKDKAAIWSLVKDIKFLEQEDFNTQQTAERMKALTNFLEINDEVERVSKKLDIDAYVSHISNMSSEKKEYITCILIWVIMADGKATEGERNLLNSQIALCDLTLPSDEKRDEIFKAIYAAGQNVSQSGNMASNSSNERDWQYYQKLYTEDLEEESGAFKWNKIIPITAQEAIGAMAFCKIYLKDNWWCKKSAATLERIIELCEEEFSDVPEVEKVLPKYKEILNNYKKEEEQIKKKKLIKTLLVCAVAIVLLILQIVFWGWWTLLSGSLTVLITIVIISIQD